MLVNFTYTLLIILNSSKTPKELKSRNENIYTHMQFYVCIRRMSGNEPKPRVVEVVSHVCWTLAQQSRIDANLRLQKHCQAFAATLVNGFDDG